MVNSCSTRRGFVCRRLLFLATVVSAGCGPAFTEHETGFDAAHFGGTIDESLSAAERERREVVRRLLLGIVAGEDIALIQKWLPGVEFRESQAAFFNGNLLLRRWDFAPSPHPTAIAVALEFVPADDAVTTRVEQRAYEVTGRHGAWVIRRLDAEATVP
jgi:hypothetical protein